MRDGWIETTLGDVVELGKGGSWGQDDPAESLIEVTCLRGTDLADLIERRNPDAPTRWVKESELKKSRCEPNMVLIETSGSKCGRSIVLSREILGSFDLPVVYSNFCRTLKIATEKVTNQYIEIWFSHHYQTGLIPSYRATSAMPNLDVKALLRVETIYIPPLYEQKRIVDLISTVDSYIEALQQHLESARKSRNAVLHELLTQGDEGWNKVSVSEVCTMIKRGQAPAYTEQKSVTVLNQKCIRAGKLDFHFSRQTDPDVKPVNDWAYLSDTDTLVNSTGVGTLGRVAYVGKLDEPATVDSHVTIVRPDDKKIAPAFLGLSLHYREPDIEGLAAGSSGQTELSREALGNLIIVIPPLPEQGRIVGIISTFDEMVSKAELAVAEAQNLRSGLLTDLLSGKHEIPASYDQLIGPA